MEARLGPFDGEDPTYPMAFTRTGRGGLLFDRDVD